GAQPGRRACSSGLAGAICRLHAVAARGAGPGGRWAERDRAPARVLDRCAQRSSRSDRSAERPAAAGGGVRLTLDPELHRGLLGLARESRASLFMVLQAALATLLTRLGSGSDIPI